MEVRTVGSNNFARLSNDLIAYKASESDPEVNGSLLSSYRRMHLSSYDGHTSSRTGHDASSRAATLKHDRRHASVGDSSVRLWSQQGQEVRNAVSSSSASAYTATTRKGQNTHRPPTAGEVRTSCLVKSTSGFGFTMADTPTGHMVKLMAEPLGHGQLQPGDIIVMIDGVDVRRQSHENTVAMLKSYSPGSTVIFSYVRPSKYIGTHRCCFYSLRQNLYQNTGNHLQTLFIVLYCMITRQNCAGQKRDKNHYLFDSSLIVETHRKYIKYGNILNILEIIV